MRNGDIKHAARRILNTKFPIKASAGASMKHLRIVKISVLTCLASISSLSLLGQSKNTWIAFLNKDSTLIGYKDHNGAVKIEPKFENFTSAIRFDDIIAAIEERRGKWSSYYLTKSGNVVGMDSLYFIDNIPDCESEGFIRFSDKKTGNVGMFDRTGKVAIPAIYNYLTNVRNGMITGLRGAEKKLTDGGEHYQWIGGREFLIDTSNHILIEDFASSHHLNFFTLEKSKAPHPDTIRKSFLATDGFYYSFVDFEKEFKQWLAQDLLNNLTVDRLIANSYDTIVWESARGWKKSASEKLITNNYSTLKNGLLKMLLPKTEYLISLDGLNPYLLETTEFEQYFNNCGEPKDWIYPTMSVIIFDGAERKQTQNHYEFLRTDKGYKLISLTMRNAKLQ